MKNGLDEQYIDLLKDILNNGVEKTDRTGTGTISVFGRQIRHKMSDGFPLLTTKKMYFKGIITELIWFLRGDTSIEYLLKNDCNIWTGDAYQSYLKECERLPYTKEEFIDRIKTNDEFAKTWGSLGKIYGYQWRKWNDNIDQISELIKQLKENPDSRRLLVSAWNISDLPNQVLPPCHYSFQVYTRELSLDERINIYNSGVVPMNQSSDYFHWHMDDYGIPRRAISLMYNARSQDVPLGTPYNISSYSLLLMMIAKQVNMLPDEVIANMGDCHIYKNQIEGVKEQITKEPYPLPTLKISDRIVNDISEYNLDDFKLENYQSHKKIYFPLSN
jgi:thymidylate synthase